MQLGGILTLTFLFRNKTATFSMEIHTDIPFRVSIVSSLTGSNLKRKDQNALPKTKLRKYPILVCTYRIKSIELRIIVYRGHDLNSNFVQKKCLSLLLNYTHTMI